MSQIHQVQLQFLPAEDRLLLKISTTDTNEFRFLLTRRYVALLYPSLTKAIDKETNSNFSPDSSVNTYHDQRVAEEMIKLQHEKLVQKANTTSHYKNNDYSYPLGEQPILLVNISTSFADDQLKLSLTPESGKGVTFSIDQTLGLQLRHLLVESAAKAEWRLEFKINPPSASFPNQSDQRILH